MSLRSLLKEITPPVAVKLARLVVPPPPHVPPVPVLFDGSGELFIEALANATVYGEYGCGLSTIFVSNNSRAIIHSVDTSNEWINRTFRQMENIDLLELRHVDVGPLGDWGFPLSYEKRENFQAYMMSPWERLQSPDMVLIDGRFRVACFLTTMLRARPGTAVIFDDYPERPPYHLVEELVKPDRVNARQARFTVPSDLDRPAAEHLLNKFEYVLD